MKNNFNIYKNEIFKNLAKRNNVLYGNKLKCLRQSLLLKPEDLAAVLTISTNTIKKAEQGGNVGIEIINEIVLFYGFTIDQFYSTDSVPNWQDFKKQIEKFHKEHKSESYKIINQRPQLIDLIEYRLLKSDFFKQWVDEDQLLEFCNREYNYNYSSATNTLNNCVQKGWLIIDENAKPKKYSLKKK